MRKIIVSLSLVLIILFIGCTVKYAPKPELKKDAELEERKEQYEKYSIVYTGNFFTGPAFNQDKNVYKKDGIRDNLQLDEKAYSKFKSGSAMEAIGAIFGGVSGGCIGYYLGNSLAGGDPSNGLLIAGGASIVVGVIFAVIADGKYEESVTLYNKYLKNELNLSEEKISFNKPGRQRQFNGSLTLLNIKI